MNCMNKQNKLLINTINTCADFLSKQIEFMNIRDTNEEIIKKYRNGIEDETVSSFLFLCLELSVSSNPPEYMELIIQIEYETIIRGQISKDALETLVVLKAISTRVLLLHDYDYFYMIFSHCCSSEIRDSIARLLNITGA